jgi:hypothetical protein
VASSLALFSTAAMQMVTKGCGTLFVVLYQNCLSHCSNKCTYQRFGTLLLVSQTGAEAAEDILLCVLGLIGDEIGREREAL